MRTKLNTMAKGNREVVSFQGKLIRAGLFAGPDGRQYYVSIWRALAAEVVRKLAVAVFGTATRSLTATRASFILTPSDGGLWGGLKTTAQFPLGGLNSIEVARLRDLPERREPPFRVASIGRLVVWKGFGLGLMAFAALHKDPPGSA